jgi:parallel beta-helix repeat protein
MRKISTLLLILVLLIASSIATFLPVNAESKTITVPDNYPTIQAAIGNASAGDTIFVRKGTYNENIVIDKPLSLTGEDSQETIIKGNYYRFGFQSWTILVKADDVSILGFTITGTSFGIQTLGGSYGYSASRCRIIGNNIENNFENGIFIYSGEDHTIKGNNITGNGMDGISISFSNCAISENNITENKQRGISVTGSNEVIINQNNISGNGIDEHTPSDLKGGLQLQSTGPFYVYGNNITYNQGCGVQFEYCSNALVYQNNIEHNDIGVDLDNLILTSEATAGSGNVVFNNNLINNSENAFVDHVNPTDISNIPDAIGNGTDIVLWDNGTIGNYWSDYLSRYPNAAEVDTSGIGNTPYIVDENNTDHYPLTQQVDISTASPPPSTPRSILTELIAIAAITSIVMGIILLIYFKKRKH